MDVPTALNILYQAHGSWKDAAEAVGIKYTTFYNYTKGGGEHNPSAENKVRIIRAAQHIVDPPTNSHIEKKPKEVLISESVLDAIIFSVKALDSQIEYLEYLLAEAKDNKSRLHARIEKISGELNK